MDPFRLDSTLLERFRTGSEDALEQVYLAFLQPLRNFILRGFAFKSDGRDLFFRGVWTDHDLDDIIQETFRRAFGFKARQSYDGVRPYKNYLFTIARNAVINDLMAKNRQIPVGDAITADSMSTEDLGPLESWILSQRHQLDGYVRQTAEEDVENLEVYAMVTAFLEELDDDEQRFFELRFLGGLSQENTARRIGCNRARVRKLEAKLRKRFLCLLQGTGYLEHRKETQKVRRPENPERAEESFRRSRAIWRQSTALARHEILSEAA